MEAFNVTTATLILTILLLACSVGLIIIITLQGDRSASASAVTGDIGNFYNKNKTATRELKLKRATVILSILFMVAILIVNILESVA